MSSNDLQHYGVLGMKWGVRRSNTKLSRSKNNSDNHSKKNVKDMSDDELRKTLNRIQMERQYSRLSPSGVDRGREYTQKIIKAGTTIATVSTTALTIYNNYGKIRDIIRK